MLMIATVLACTALWVAGRWRAPAIVVLYTAGIVLSGMLSSGVDLTARYILTAFPLLIAAGRVLRNTALLAAAATGAAAMAALMILAAATNGYTPCATLYRLTRCRCRAASCPSAAGAAAPTPAPR